MVIGSGLIGRAFFRTFLLDRRTVIFASGVSHSKGSNAAEFARERTLLQRSLKANAGMLFVYFSTCSVYDPTECESPYVKHKLAMEAVVMDLSSNYLIFRVSNVVGHSDNPTTIFNFLVQHIRNESPFDLWKEATRNIIDVQHVVEIVTFCIRAHNGAGQIINIANPFHYKVLDIARKMESYFKKAGNFRLIDAGSSFRIDTGISDHVAKQIGITFEGDYIGRLLKKYYKVKAEITYIKQ